MIINISEFPKHIFWNYKSDAELDEEIVTYNVLLYGDIPDYKKLVKIVNRDSLVKAVAEIEKTGRNKKRVNFIKKILL
ncbi:MAG: hypothetical protein LH629_04335 [Ignavibacteria bacterium]|nr:hypothetical protein [Ignavibacteria bacterium]